jgi:hypothetical protein
MSVSIRPLLGVPYTRPQQAAPRFGDAAASKSRVTMALESLPSVQNEALNLLVPRLLADQVGYVVMGSKPMCWNFKTGKDGKLPPETQAAAWTAWDRMMTQLPHPGFLFRYLGEKEQDYVIVHREAALQALGANTDIVQRTHPGKTPEQVLDRLMTCTKPQFDAEFRDQTGLFGILLGYGRVNALLRERQQDVDAAIQQQQSRTSRCAETPIITPREGYATLEDERDVLSRQGTHTHLSEPYQALKRRWPSVKPIDLFFPAFEADLSHPETRAILARYSEDHDRLRAVLTGPAPTENFFTAMTPRPSL